MGVGKAATRRAQLRQGVAIDSQLEEKIRRNATSLPPFGPSTDEIVAAWLILTTGFERSGSHVGAKAGSKRLARGKARIEALQNGDAPTGLARTQIGAAA